MTMGWVRAEVVGRRVLVAFSFLGLACGGASQMPAPGDGLSPSSRGDAGMQPSIGFDGGSPSTAADGGQPPRTSDGGPPTAQTDGGATHAPGDAMSSNACGLPTIPGNVCSALPAGKVVPCSQTGGQPSQTGYLEIDSPGSPPVYVCATSWSPDPSIGYIFGQPETFMSQAQSCCGGAASATAVPTVPDLSIGSAGAPHIPSHLKPPEMQHPGSGPLRQDPFAIVVTDTSTAAAATAAMSMWLSWGGDRQPHTAPDGTGPYYFASGFPINYVVLETAEGAPVIVIGPEVSLTADGMNLLGHPTLGVCATGGGAPLALIAGEVKGTTLSNHSGRYDYGASATAQTLNVAAQLFNCMGVRITETKFYPPKS